MTVLATAIAAIKNRISVIPIRNDGSKAPTGTWKRWEVEIASTDQARLWFNNNPSLGLAVIGGKVSGNLEILDFDNRQWFDKFKQVATKVGLIELVNRIEAGYFESTPNGFHLIYRCEVPIDGNTKLASFKLPDGTIKCAIETRGEGGYAIIAPSKGRVHPSGKAYELISGDIDQLVTITGDERADLLALAIALDEVPKEPPPAPATAQASVPSGDNLRAGDDFNERASWRDVLVGWAYVGRNSAGGELWRRPGKREGVSATTSYNDKDLFYCFSSSTEFEQEKPYSKFAVYTILNHNGDFAAAAKALAAKGYGDQPPTSTASTTPDHETLRFYHLTDTGNGRRLVDRFGQDMRFVKEWGWMCWNGKFWEADKTGAARRFAKKTVATIYREAAQIDGDDPQSKSQREAIAQWAMKSESKARIDAMLDMAHDEIEIVARPSDFDKQPMVLNCQNGTLNLATGGLRPHNRADLITKILPIAYDPTAKCPTWLTFLNRTMGGNEGLVNFLQRAIGYSLTGDTREQCLFFLYGTGSNGKSTLLEVLLALFGDYAQPANPAAFLAKDNNSDAPRNDIAGMAGARLIKAVESEKGRRWAEALIKELTGSDTIRARFLHKEEFSFKPVFKLWFAANNKPVVKGQDNGIWRRIRLIPFEVTFSEKEKDTKLAEKLKAELPGILAWAIEGCRLWQAGGLQEPDEVKVATAQYRDESDTLKEFFNECCVKGRADKCRVVLIDLYKAYVKWCDENSDKAMSKRSFASALQERNFVVTPAGKNKVTVFGLSLLFEGAES